MALVTWATYISITGDNDSAEADVIAALADSQTLLEEYLGRRGTLESAARTETLRIDRSGKVWPTATPVTVSTDEITDDGHSISGASSAATFWLDPDTKAEVTYTGGYSASTVPYAIKRAIAFGAKELLDNSLTTIPAGATSVRLGDASITFGSPSGTALQAFNTPLLKRHQARNI